MSFTLSYQQMRLVKATIPTLREKGETITSIFYKEMLKNHPELNNYFNSVNQANHRQPRALTSIILAFASAINYDMSELIPKLERMCNKHCSLGIKPEHYEVVAVYLIRAFKVVLGPAMTPDTEVAWNKAYWILAKMLIGREKQIYTAFGSWKGWKPFRIERKESETDDIISFYLTPQDKKPPARLPPWAIHICANEPTTDAPHENYYRITVKKESGHSDYPAGVMTSFLVDSLSPGDFVDVTHPAGEFFLDTNNYSSVPIVLISAGVGVAPMVSMLNTVMDLQPMREVSWVHGARRMIPFYNHIRAAKKKMPNLRTNIFKTHLAEQDLAGVTYDYDYRVDLAKVGREDLFLHHGGTEYFICGPEQFMIEMADYLKMQGVGIQRVKFELFSTGDMVEIK
ncbi:hypothetical protein INS49_006198 [Diaporthe citri]|uniref:uncharacterized protein n=1 Tax=Diaporthe citri TaxID=83186 RepID=UPI001C7FC305|nr:uncharacterized protein INS49_006198 [Diaporthe citri]KAG6364596.1 hypothetical protein INS49_006198 [Diaporthe citri]